MIVNAIHIVGDWTVGSVVCYVKLQIPRDHFVQLSGVCFVHGACRIVGVSIKRGQKMTPLPRWVLLAMLLPLLAAHPRDHACVRLCRARNTRPEITGVCEHQRELVLQSSGGRVPKQRLLRLCLTPCHDTATSNPPSFDDSRICREFRDSVIRRRACSCEFHFRPSHEKLVEKQRDIVPESQKNQLKTGLSVTLTKAEEELEAVIPVDAEDRQDPRSDEVKETKHNSIMTEIEDSSVSVDPNPGSPMDEFEEEEEDSVDWDLWCMAQCDNGKGGSACNCDIIP